MAAMAADQELQRPSIEHLPEAHGNPEDDEDDEEEVDEEEEEEAGNELLARLSNGTVRVRVHDVVIKGNTVTKDSIIEAEVADLFRSVSTLKELVQAAATANAMLRQLGIFDSVSITLDAGPPELSGTANVVIQVVEAKNPLTGDIGIYTRPEARSWTLEASLKRKNYFGYGDIWDASLAYGWDQTTELGVGVYLPRFRVLSSPLSARISLLTQDWLKFSSYKEHLLGLSLGLFSKRQHDLSYNLTWRALADPSQMASKLVRRQLGHSLLSSIKYTFKVDHRDSFLRPRNGYAFLSTTQIAGLGPDSKSLRFLRQEFDLRGALPLGFYNAALNVGVSAGFVMPWGRGFMNKCSPLPDRFFMGGHSSPVCTLAGPTSLLGFKFRGLGPTDSRRHMLSRTGSEDSTASPGRDVLGGDIAVTAFADVSFDLPLKLFREAGIHCHAFVCVGNLAKLLPQELKSFSLQKFRETFRSSTGFGLIIPTKLFRMEINYCYILKQFDHDQGKTGIQFNFSSP